MIMENVSAMEDLCTRGMLPPEFKDLVETIGIKEVSAKAIRTINDIIGLTEGQAIINRLMARMLDAILLSAEQAAAIEGVPADNSTSVDLDLDLDPPAVTEPIIPPAQVEPEAVDPGNQSDEERARQRGLTQQPPPPNYTPPADPKPAEPLDHDGDGGKGGSLKGEASTAAKGAARKRTPSKPKAKAKAKPKSKAKPPASPR